MAKHGKKYQQAAQKVEMRPYALRDALEVAKGAAYAKFDETVEVALRLGVDPKHADQMVRGTVVLPHGLGKTSRVLVFAAARSSARPKRRERTMSAATSWRRRSRAAGSNSTPWSPPRT